MIKEKLFPIIPPEESQPLRIINAFMLEHSGVGGSTELYSTAKMFAEIRGTYVARSLTNMAQATLNTARARNPDGFYKKGDCSISSYKVCVIYDLMGLCLLMMSIGCLSRDVGSRI